MRRREFLAGACATTASLGIGATPSMAAASLPSLRAAATQAWIWGLPLVEMAAQRNASFADGTQPNTFKHQRALITAKSQFVTTPNNDTLYSTAWLDLRKGPVSLSVPASGSRYYCVPLMDMYSNNFAIVGTRTAGPQAQSFTVIGPNEKADIPRAIRAPTDSVWLLGRTLVVDDADLAAAHAFQDGWTIRGPAAEAPSRFPDRRAKWSDYFGAVQTLMNENPPAPMDAGALAAMAPLLQYGGTFDPARFSPEQVAQIQAGIGDVPARLAGLRRQALARNGWSYPLASLGNFGQDFDYRAAVAVGGLAALPPVEAMYLRNAGPAGTGFDSAGSWRLSFAAQQMPPVHAFWSLSMYRQMPDGALYFAENAVARYAIGDRTPGLRRGADGSLDILMSRTPPADPSANWLPTPGEGPFVLILRAYLPRLELLQAIYQLPPVQAA